VSIRRGDVVWVDPGPTLGSEQGGRRPYLVISHEVFNERLKTVIALALTRRPPRMGYPLTRQLSSGGLPKKSWVKIGQVRTVSVLRLGRRIGRLDEEEVDAVVEGLLDIVGP
jgi:mRNA interferase MazF